MLINLGYLLCKCWLLLSDVDQTEDQHGFKIFNFKYYFKSNAYAHFIKFRKRLAVYSPSGVRGGCLRRTMRMRTIRKAG